MSDGWLSDLPSEWGVLPLKWLATFIAGGTPDSGNEDYWSEGDDGVPWIAISDMSNRDEVTYTAKSVSRAGLAEKRLTVAPPGTLLLAMYASVGEVATTTFPAVWNQAILGIVPGMRLSQRFLNYVLRAARDHLVGQARSNTQANLNAEQVGNLKVPVPNREAQQVIADFLDRETAEIDAFIADQERLIELLTERRLNFILELTRAAQIMAGRGSAESTRLGSLFSVQLGKMLDGGKAPRTGEFINGYLRASNVKQGRLDLADVKSMPFSPEERRLYSLLKDDLLVVEGGATSGASTVLDRDIPEYAFQKTLNRVRRIDPREANDTRFLALALEGFKALGLVDVLCNQSTMPHLTAEKLRGIRVPWPSREARLRVIDECKELTTEIDAAIADAREAIALSKERRAALISAAVTGKIDIRN